MATAARKAPPSIEADEIVRWRSDELRRAGYRPRAALVLALRRDVDLHVAVELLEHGCPAHVALRILL